MRSLTLSALTVLIGILVLIALGNGCGAEMIEEVASMPNEPETCSEAVCAPQSNETVEDEEIIVRDVKVPLTAEEETYEAPDEIQVETFEEIYDEIPEDIEADIEGIAPGDVGGGDGEDVGELETINTAPAMHSYGQCTITHYDDCPQCCGQWSGGNTASGVPPTVNHTVACNGLPFGTRLMINGQEYIVEDRGDSRMGDFWIDIFVGSHDEALARGMYSADVYIIDE